MGVVRMSEDEVDEKERSMWLFLSIPAHACAHINNWLRFVRLTCALCFNSCIALLTCLHWQLNHVHTIPLFQTLRDTHC